MKAVVFHGIGDIRIDDVPEPKLEQPTDAIVRITSSAICGTELHMIRGTFANMVPGTILGHEGVGVVEQLGPDVRDLNVGDRVVIASTVACGYCSYCRAGYYAQCDNANPNGPLAGPAFFGGPKESGPFHGLQAEKARIPFANVGLIKLPDKVSDHEAILLSDIFPTAYQAAEMAKIKPGHTVAIFGCGPVGQLAILSAKQLRAGRIFAVDTIPDRLAMARAQGAEVIDYEAEDPVETIRRLTGGIGVDCVIDAVGVDANRPHRGPAAQQAQQQASSFQQELQQIAPQTHPQNGNWCPGDAPSQVSQWTVQAIAKAGTISIVGGYPPPARTYPIGVAMHKNLRLNMGFCHHRRYIPMLLQLVQSGAVEPLRVLTQTQGISDAVNAYKAFDKREPGWMKVELVTSR
jgi:threonine dehydrogenase-like Zn-dependent dehydrogenase